MSEIELGPRIGVGGGARAVRPSATIETPLTDEEKAKFAAVVQPPAAPFPPGRAAHGVVVEDDPHVRLLLGALLKHWELEVTELGSGTEALTTLASRRVDLALVDLRLPGHDGYEVIRCARSYLKLRDTVILAVSALDDPKDEVAALNLGADAFFRKPFSLQLLEARLKPFVRRLYDRLGG